MASKKRAEEAAKTKEDLASVEGLDIQLFPEITALLPAITTFLNQRREVAGLELIAIGEENIRLIDSRTYQENTILQKEAPTDSPAFYDSLNRFIFISIDQGQYRQERWYQAYLAYALIHELAHLSMTDNGLSGFIPDDFSFIMNEAVADLLAKECYANLRPSILSDEEKTALENRRSLDEINLKLLQKYNGLIQVDASEIVFMVPGSLGEGIAFSRVKEMQILEILENISPGYRDEVINYALNGDPAGLIAASKARFAGEPCKFIIEAYGDVTDKLRRLRQLYPLR